MQETRQFNVLLVGDGSVGKTTFMNTLLNVGFDARYSPTIGVNKVSHTIHTNTGLIEFTVKDVAGQEKFNIPIDQYCEGVDACIFMFDVTSKLSYKNSFKWKNCVTFQLPVIPTVTVGNKIDVTCMRLHQNQIDRSLMKHYIEISSKSCTNCNQVFLHLARKLTENDELNIEE